MPLGDSSSSTTTSNMTDNSSGSNATSTKKVFPCNACDLVFDDSQSQRTHMREPWQTSVYNLKRRMSDLPPIPADAYTDNVARTPVSPDQYSPEVTSLSKASRARVSIEESSDDSDDSKTPTREQNQAQINSCLFCTRNSNSLQSNLEHMSQEHGLYIPKLEHLSSLETMIEYLHTVITGYNECIYCGVFKQSTAGVQRHMRDKGHCMLNLKREPELLEFWDLSDSDGLDLESESDIDGEDVTKSEAEGTTTDANTTTSMLRDLSLSQDEYVLPSGRTIGSKNKARESRLSARRAALATAKMSSIQSITGESTNDDKSTDTVLSTNSARELLLLKNSSRKRTEPPNPDRAVTVRDAAGLIGVSDQQVRSLVTLQRKIQRQQAVVNASASWADELGGRSQKHGKVKMDLRSG